MDFIPTKGQGEALLLAEKFLASPEFGVFVLTGYSGAGKTTLTKVFCELYGVPVFLTPTGKAALRVEEVTGAKASTIHRYLYRPTEDTDTGEPVFKMKNLGEVEIPDSGYIVVDEASMVGIDLWNDLYKVAQALRIKIFLIGDTFQLPPIVKKGEKWVNFSILTDILVEYRAHLSEVTRQALDSPILRATVGIRAGEFEAMAALKDLPKIKYAEVPSKYKALANNSKAILCHKNITRHKLNSAIRDFSGLGSEIELNEPLLVLANNYQVNRYNGEILEFSGWMGDRGEMAVRDRWRNISEFVDFGQAYVENHLVILSTKEINGKTEVRPNILSSHSRIYAASHWGYERVSAPSFLSCNYGYALTTHKSQGQEYDNVIVCLEKSIGNGYLYSYEGRRFIYTAVSRAKKDIDICWDME